VAGGLVAGAEVAGAAVCSAVGDGVALPPEHAINITDAVTDNAAKRLTG
jgi:hypothetical protein